MSIGSKGMVGILMRFASGLRFPYLFLLTLGLFLADLVFPDFMPFVDEALLGLLALLLGTLKQRAKGEPSDRIVDAAVKEESRA